MKSSHEKQPGQHIIRLIASDEAQMERVFLPLFRPEGAPSGLAKVRSRSGLSAGIRYLPTLLITKQKETGHRSEGRSRSRLSASASAIPSRMPRRPCAGLSTNIPSAPNQGAMGTDQSLKLPISPAPYTAPVSNPHRAPHRAEIRLPMPKYTVNIAKPTMMVSPNIFPSENVAHGVILFQSRGCFYLPPLQHRDLADQPTICRAAWTSIRAPVAIRSSGKS